MWPWSPPRRPPAGRPRSSATSIPHLGRWACPADSCGWTNRSTRRPHACWRPRSACAGIFLEQLYTFGRPDRDPRTRVITVAYYALVDAASSLAVASRRAACQARDAARSLAGRTGRPGPRPWTTTAARCRSPSTMPTSSASSSSASAASSTMPRSALSSCRAQFTLRQLQDDSRDDPRPHAQQGFVPPPAAGIGPDRSRPASWKQDVGHRPAELYRFAASGRAKHRTNHPHPSHFPKGVTHGSHLLVRRPLPPTEPPTWRPPAGRRSALTKTFASTARPPESIRCMDPAKLKEAAANRATATAHPASRAVAVLFDVTGSMQAVPRILQENLCRLFDLLVDKQVPDRSGDPGRRHRRRHLRHRPAAGRPVRIGQRDRGRPGPALPRRGRRRPEDRVVRAGPVLPGPQDGDRLPRETRAEGLCLPDRRRTALSPRQAPRGRARLRRRLAGRHSDREDRGRGPAEVRAVLHPAQPDVVLRRSGDPRRRGGSCWGRTCCGWTTRPAISERSRRRSAWRKDRRRSMTWPPTCAASGTRGNGRRGGSAALAHVATAAAAAFGWSDPDGSRSAYSLAL